MWGVDAAGLERRRLNAIMGAACDEVVVVKQGMHQGDPSEITVNCPDKIGLGCDLARIVFEFGLTVVKGDLQTDGRWCFVVLKVVPSSSARSIRWPLLKQRLAAACPLSLFDPPTPPESKLKQMYLLQLCSLDRAGLLNDVAQLLWELELTIRKVKVSTTPEGKAVDLFYVTDNRDKLPGKDRVSDVCDQIRNSLKDASTLCALLEAGPECGLLDCSPASHLPAVVADCLFNDGVNDRAQAPKDKLPRDGMNSAVVEPSFSIDNVTSPQHSILQISCRDRKGLLYDSLRALKNVKLQVSYGRIAVVDKTKIDIEVFLLQPDGRKITDPQKQRNLVQLIERETQHPLRVSVINRGPDTELLVATPIELSGRGRPRVLYDITLALKMMEICIFKADITRHVVGDRYWEVYRFLLIEKVSESLATDRMRSLIADRVRNILMGAQS